MGNQSTNHGSENFPLLLPKTAIDDQISKGASVSSAVFNISTTMVGAGIMSIPATIKTLGLIPGFMMILIVAVLADITVEFMLRYTEPGNSNTYAGVLAESFGPFGSFAVQICVVVTNLGCLIIYLIIIGDVLCGDQSGETIHLGVLQEWFGIHWWNSRACIILLVVIFVMLPLVLLRQVDSLRHTSALSIALAVVFVVICSAMAIYELWRGETQKLRLLPDFSNEVSVFDLFTTVPVLVTAFGFHVNVHSIRAELDKQSNMSLATRISLFFCVAIYFGIGFFGYLLFGDAVMPDMLVNFDRGSDSAFGLILNDIVRLSYAFHLALVFPIMNFSLRSNVDELVFRNKSTSLADDSPRFVLITIPLLVFTYIVAVAIPNIWYVFQIVGSTTFVCLSFIFPAALVLRDIHGISTTKDKIIAVVVISLATMSSGIAIYSNLFG